MIKPLPHQRIQFHAYSLYHYNNLRTSAWAKGDDIEDQAKIHIRPYDEKVYWSGWYDYHRAGGPDVHRIQFP